VFSFVLFGLGFFVVRVAVVVGCGWGFLVVGCGRVFGFLFGLYDSICVWCGLWGVV